MVTRRVLSVTAVAALLVACFGDLPAPTKCPADPQRAVGDCLPVLASSKPMAGCIPQAAHECILGPRTDCSCGASECPPSASECSPPPDCPSTVHAMVPSASCPAIGDAQGGPCTCGCAKCVSACDGYGPSVGALLPSNAPAVPLLEVPLGSGLPSSGKLGFYVRLRGASRMLISVLHGNQALAETTSFVPEFPADAQFREVIVTPDMGAAWSTADQAPTAIALVAAPGPGMDAALTYVQIDCVVPILVH